MSAHPRRRRTQKHVALADPDHIKALYDRKQMQKPECIVKQRQGRYEVEVV